METKDIQYLSEEKFNELKKELEDLTTIKRKEIAENLGFAKSLGDLKENAEYHEAREAQANLEDRISLLEKILKEAVIVSGNNKDAVGLGSVVSIKNESNKETKKFQIVGSEEAKILAGKISNTSPLGYSLMGKKVGSIINVTTPKGQVQYKIVEIK